MNMRYSVECFINVFNPSANLIYLIYLMLS